MSDALDRDVQDLARHFGDERGVELLAKLVRENNARLPLAALHLLATGDTFPTVRRKALDEIARIEGKAVSK